MERLQYLLECYQKNQCTEAEMEELNEWFHTWNPGTEDMQQWLQESGGPQSLQKDMYSSFQQRMERPAASLRIGLIYRVAAAAVVLAVITFFLYQGKRKSAEQAQVSANEKSVKPFPTIAPGTDKAVLKLADGTEIELTTDANNVRIATQNNTVIDQVGKGSIAYTSGNNKQQGEQKPVYNTLSTPRGGKYSLILADGTAVTLDASSSITYPVSFAGNERQVEITGQAYFEVVHNAAWPFRVKVKGQIIEDIGTAFNVNAYGDDQLLKITLAEGRVDIHNSSKKVSLMPGQQALIKEGQENIQVKKADVEETVAWKNGRFIFHKEKIQGIMKQAERWYDVEIAYEGQPINKLFGGNISRYVDISELLENLKITGGIRYRIEERKVVLMN